MQVATHSFQNMIALHLISFFFGLSPGEVAGSTLLMFNSLPSSSFLT